jgi:hypothetical protein
MRRSNVGKASGYPLEGENGMRTVSGVSIGILAGIPGFAIPARAQSPADAAGTKTPKESGQQDVTILDVYENMARVRVIFSEWVNCLQVAKFNGRWVIVNVLWEYKPRPNQK